MVLFLSGNANKQWSEGTIWLPEKCSWALGWMTVYVKHKCGGTCDSEEKACQHSLSACLGVPRQDTEALFPIYERIPLHMQHCFSHIIRGL